MANPLTTSFTPPASCFDGPWTSAVATTGVPVLFRENNNNCRPEPDGGNVAYSPGMCPVGFTTAKASIASAETYAVCCPSGFLADGDSLCLSTGATATSIDCIYNAGVTAQVTGACTPGSAPSGALFFQNNIEVIYGQADLSLFPAGYTPGPVGIEMPRQTAPATAVHHGTSKGIIAGVAVGLVVLVLLQAGMVYYLCFVRRRQRAKAAAGGELAQPDQQTDHVEAWKAAAKAKELELEDE